MLANVWAKRNKNICKRRKYKLTSGSRVNMKLTNFVMDYQDPSKILKIFELKDHLIGRLLDSFC